MLVLGLDRFRDVNDTLGRAQGDAVLREVATRIRRSVRSTDTVARIEGDRFGVLLPGLKNGDATGAAEKILAALSRQIDVAGAALSIDATVGVATAPEHSAQAEQLLQRAEAAMYRAKRLQKRLGFFTAELEEERRGGSRSSRPSSAPSTCAPSRSTTSRRSSWRAARSSASRRSRAGPTRCSDRSARARSCRSPSAPASPSRSRSSRSRSPPPTAPAGRPTAASRPSP